MGRTEGTRLLSPKTWRDQITRSKNVTWLTGGNEKTFNWINLWCDGLYQKTLQINLPREVLTTVCSTELPMSTVVLDLQNHDDEGKNCQQNDDDDRRLHWHLCKKLIAIIGPRPTFVTALHQKTAGERLRELPNFFLVFLNILWRHFREGFVGESTSDPIPMI